MSRESDVRQRDVHVGGASYDHFEVVGMHVDRLDHLIDEQPPIRFGRCVPDRFDVELAEVGGDLAELLGDVS